MTPDKHGWMKRALVVPCAVAAGLLAACSGGSQPAPPAAVAPSRAAVAAYFTITVPPAATAAATARRPAFISPATRSIVIVLAAVDGSASTAATTTIAANLTPGSPNCSGTPLICTVAAPGAPGSDTFAIATYDAPQTSSTPAAPQGNLLARATITAPIVINATNTIPVVLDGVPAALAIAGLPSGLAGSAFSALAFAVAVKDAAGNTIVGSYANPVTITNSDGSGATSVTTLGSDDPPAAELLSSSDTATLAYTGLAIGPVTIGAAAANATAATARFAPVLQPITTTAASGLITLTALLGSATFSAAEAGWTNAPYNKSLTAVTPGTCSGIATVTPGGANSFTVNAVALPVIGSCTVTLTDFAGGSTAAVTIAYAATATALR